MMIERIERIEPMPEELAIAHQGRLAHFIGAQNDQHFNKWLKHQIASDATEPEQMSRLNQLAVVSGMEPTEYARMHSLLGVLRFAAQPTSLGYHGAMEGEAFSKCMGMRNQKKEAYLCPTCVKEDLEHWKFSWFRRTHHLLGVNCCPVHRTALAKVKSREPWSKLPQHWVEQGDIEFDNYSSGSLDPASFESRFCEIACALLSRPGPVDAIKLREALAVRAQQLGLRISKVGQRSLVSDLIARVAERPWLERHWPEILNKSPGAHLNSVDQLLLNSRVVGTGFAYTTILASLWDSPEEVNEFLNALGCSDSAQEKSEIKLVHKRGEKYWHGEIWLAYVATEGNVSSMAENLGLYRTGLSKKMVQIGLPNLRGVDTSPSWQAYLKFEAGMTLLEACASEHADIKEVEELIRLSCARVAKAARAVIKVRKKKFANAQTKARKSSANDCQFMPVSSKEHSELQLATRFAEQAS